MKYIYLVQESNRSYDWGSLFTWGYFSNIKEAIKTVERLKDISDKSEFQDTVELRIERVSLDLSGLDSDWDETHKLYVLYEAASDVDGHLVRNQSDWDALLEETK